MREPTHTHIHTRTHTHSQTHTDQEQGWERTILLFLILDFHTLRLLKKFVFAVFLAMSFYTKWYKILQFYSIQKMKENYSFVFLAFNHRINVLWLQTEFDVLLPLNTTTTQYWSTSCVWETIRVQNWFCFQEKKNIRETKLVSQKEFQVAFFHPPRRWNHKEENKPIWQFSSGGVQNIRTEEISRNQFIQKGF